MPAQSSHSDKTNPHPVLDNPEKMMRIIANPVYDKLTISRAAQMRSLESVKYNHTSSPINKIRSNAKLTPLKSVNSVQFYTTPLATKADLLRRKTNIVRQKSPRLELPTLLSNNESLTTNNQTINRSRSHSVISTTINDDKTFINDNSVIRYLNTQHGFEIQRYSAGNWLSVDVLSKDACEAKERTFRQMIELKEQDDMTSHSIYTSEYYRKRWLDLMKSLKQGNLTHREWAEQSYKLNCFEKYYRATVKREQSLIKLNEQKQRQRCAKTAFKEWKQTKSEIASEYRPSYITVADSFNTADITSVTSNPSSSINNTMIQTSLSTSTNTEPDGLLRSQTNQTSNSSKDHLCMLDERRWSLKAMLKRIVGLEEPLPPSSRDISYNNSSLMNFNYNNYFPSCA